MCTRRWGKANRNWILLLSVADDEVNLNSGFLILPRVIPEKIVEPNRERSVADDEVNLNSGFLILPRVIPEKSRAK